MPHRMNDNSAMRPASVRIANTALVLDHLADGSAVSRSELATRTSLTPQALGSILTDLVEEGLVLEEVRETSTPGRPPTEYSLDPLGSLTASVIVRQADFFVLLDNALQERLVTRRVRFRPENCAEPLVQSILETLFREVDELGLVIGRLKHVQFAIQGTIGEHQRVVRTTTAWTERDVDIAAAIEAAFDRPIEVTATSIEQAFATYALTRIDHEPNELVAILHIGVESRILLAREESLITNRFGDGGTVTHLPVVGNERRCECGKHGCLGTVSASAVITHYRELSGIEIATAGEVIELVGQGNPDAIEAARRAVDWFARGVAPILQVIRPDHIICTGGGVGRPQSPGAQRLVAAFREHLGSDFDQIPIDVVPPPFLPVGDRADHR